MILGGRPILLADDLPRQASAEDEVIAFRVHRDGVTVLELALEQLQGERVLDEALHGPLERPCSFRASGSWTRRCTVRLSGRAPNVGSYPSRASTALAADVTSRPMRRSLSRLRR